MQERLGKHKLFLESFSKRGMEGKEGEQLNAADDDLSGQDFSNQDFSDAYLTEVNFRGANLRHTKFDGCGGLWGSVFDEADMSFVKIRKGNANEAFFRNTIMTNASLRKTTLYKANLSGAKLENADLVETSFTGADLRFANLSGADLLMASFNRCKMYGTILTGAKNVDRVFAQWIDIGANDIPLILEGEQAKEWLMRRAQE